MRKLTHAEIAAKRKSPEDMQNIKRNPIYGVCDNIRSIFNVGAIFRTSDGALIEKLYLTGYTPYPPRKEIEKVALGSVLLKMPNGDLGLKLPAELAGRPVLQVVGVMF